MGRPVNKKWFGPLADADDPNNKPNNDVKFNIAVNCQIGSNAESASGYIIRQRSSTKFLVNDTKDGTKKTPSGSGTGNVGVCKLVDKAAGGLAANEMSIEGLVFAPDSTTTVVRISKLYNRTCRDFSNNRYKWEVQDDSTSTVIVLTAI